MIIIYKEPGQASLILDVDRNEFANLVAYDDDLSHAKMWDKKEEQESVFVFYNANGNDNEPDNFHLAGRPIRGRAVFYKKSGGMVLSLDNRDVRDIELFLGEHFLLQEFEQEKIIGLANIFKQEGRKGKSLL